jgi:hypothetical protein
MTILACGVCFQSIIYGITGIASFIPVVGIWFKCRRGRCKK